MIPDTSGVPQVLVTLAPDGSLVLELPGVAGSRRQVPLAGRSVEATLLQVLHAQLRAAERGQRPRIGWDAKPTQAQVRHWDHYAAGDLQDTCAFCKAMTPEARRRVRQGRSAPLAEHGGVTIRRVRANGAKTINHAAAEELGL